MKTLLSIVVIVITSQFTSAQWIKQTVATTASLRGLSVVNEKVVWASGTGGTVIRTTDGGKTWKVMAVAGAEKLDFRDVEAFDANTAYILSIGNGESSRIYKTTDAGATWKEQFRNKNEKAFYDAMACWDREHCIAMSDPVDSHFLLLSTASGGARWEVEQNRMPDAKEGEAAFAASGTCLIVQKVAERPRVRIFLVSGGNDARVFRGLSTIDAGFFWQVFDTPITKGTSGSGAFSIAMFDAKNGVIVGGNYEKPNDVASNLAFTVDGGTTWTLGTGLGGYRSGVTYVDKRTIIAVGTNGSDISRDRGKTWKILGKEDLNSVQSKGRKATWAVGQKGMVVRLK